MSASIHDAFSSSYAQARDKFLGAAQAAGLAVDSKVHPMPGRGGEQLAMDVALDGPADAKSLLILTSACHGVEGYCGSGVQVDALRNDAWRADARARGVAVLYIHALNPYGFSHIRRTTHENVDLNRNFQAFDQLPPPNKAYRALHPLLLPATWPPTKQNERAITGFIQANGEAAYQAAITRGQHEFPDGLFFGGHAPTWSNLTLREVLRTYGRQAQRIGWIDVHTGLGPSGVGERIYAGRDDAAAVARAREWWGGGGKTRVTSIYDGSSTSAFLTGLMFNAVYDECPQAEYTGIALEYGTLPMLETLDALRGEHWLAMHPEAPQEQADAIKQRLFEAFYTDTQQWREKIVGQAREALGQAVQGVGR